MNQFHPLRIAAVHGETREAIAITFEVPAELEDLFRFQAGQYLTLRRWFNGEELRRNYSLCSAPQDGHLRVAIKRVSGGIFSSWANENLKVGDTLHVLPPGGSFVHTPASSLQPHYLAIAAGSGITPVLSIIRSVLLTEPASRFTLVYGNRAAHSVMFREELEDLKDRFLARLSLLHVLSREPRDVELFNARIDLVKCKTLLKQWIDPLDLDAVYLCGPQSMMDAATTALIEAGVNTDCIRREVFTINGARIRERAPGEQPTARGQCHVTVVQDGRARAFTMGFGQESVLAAALSWWRLLYLSL
jgi:ring-1,2-phenylacetyl-CoA epoxidase subunit PaaE